VDERYDCLYDFYNTKNSINNSSNISNDNIKKEKSKHFRHRLNSNNSNDQELEMQKQEVNQNKEENNENSNDITNENYENNENNENNDNSNENYENNENSDYIKENDFDSLTDLVSGYDYSYKPFNRKRRRALDTHLKFLNKSVKKKKFITYDSSPSKLSYDTQTCFAFSDYTLGLENNDNKNHLLFSQMSEIVRKYENNEKTGNYSFNYY